MSPDQLKYLVALNAIPEVGPARLKAILTYFDTPHSAWTASVQDFILAHINPAIAQRIVEQKKHLDPDRIWQKLTDGHINVILITDRDYPVLLRNLPTAPPVLYYRGNIAACHSAFAIVGTRKITDYGRRACQKIIPELVSHNLTIVSGLALGIDAQAHETTLQSHGRTWAVLAGGLDDASIFPRANLSLAKRILDQDGCLLSEHPPKTPSMKYHFPLRNRIVAGLCLGTLVIEAPAGSGAMITAYQAVENNREVFAVPGPIESLNSAGPHSLTKKGAALITGGADILEILNLNVTPKPMLQPQTLNGEENRVFLAISQGIHHLDELVHHTGLEIQKLNSILTLLEIHEHIKSCGGGRYISNL